MNKIFYHASSIPNLNEILPLSKMHGSGEKVCYFTPVRAYALFYLRDKETDHVTCGISNEGIVTYEEQFPNQLKTIYQNRSGCLYICENNGRISLGNKGGVWTSNKPVAISYAEIIKDVYAEILNAESDGNVAVIRYEQMSEHRKAEIAQMIKNYIINNHMTAMHSPKSRFFAENFPQAWEMASKTAAQ